MSDRDGDRMGPVQSVQLISRRFQKGPDGAFLDAKLVCNGIRTQPIGRKLENSPLAGRGRRDRWYRFVAFVGHDTLMNISRNPLEIAHITAEEQIPIPLVLETRDRQDRMFATHAPDRDRHPAETDLEFHGFAEEIAARFRNPVERIPIEGSMPADASFDHGVERKIILIEITCDPIDWIGVPEIRIVFRQAAHIDGMIDDMGNAVLFPDDIEKGLNIFRKIVLIERIQEIATTDNI